MIPKIIHYCWFGRNPLPKSAKKCIASWKKYFPDYEIKEWNEDNFDVNIIPYTQEAYSLKKYAFVSDYARFYILYKYGGIYFDTDVEVIKPMNDIIEHGAFMGIETTSANAGLGIAAGLGMSIYREILDKYSCLSFLDSNGKPFPGTVVTHVTEILVKHGFKQRNELQQIANITIYPNDYFNPLDDATGKIHLTSNTRSIHWYAKTWVDNYGPIRTWVTRWIHRIFGVNSLSWLRKYI